MGFPSLPSLRGHVLAAVDVETTGVFAGYHEIVQIAVVPLNQHFEPSSEYKFFYLNMCPKYLDRIDEKAQKIHGLTPENLEGCVSQERGIELFEEWHKNLNLPLGKRLIPLAHNYAFERAFLIQWLGMDSFNYIFQSHPRDTMIIAALINDLYVWHGRKHPFNFYNLEYLAEKFDIEFDSAHNALADCLATARLYSEFMRFLHG